MAHEPGPSLEDARTAAPEQITVLLATANENILRALIENPSFDETHLCLLLERKDLPGTLLGEIAKKTNWRTNYRVSRALAGHPHTPRLAAIRLLRELHLMDLVRISLQPASPVELRRLAEERVLAQLPQLPLGQRIMLARRASARVAGGLIAQGAAQVTKIALDNPLLTESQLLRSLAKESLPAQTVEAIAEHEKWSKLMNIRVAVLRHPHAPAERVLCFLPDLPLRDLEELSKQSGLPEHVRDHVSGEIASRK
jgi:predicted regulator of amino acid metabolism with ACT domain